MMKKYLIGSGALVLALSLSAFNAFRVNDTFNYNHSTFSLSDVENTANYVSVVGVSCDAFKDVPCSITVPEADTKIVNGKRILDPAKVSITASDPDGDGYFKISSVVVTTGTATFDNTIYN